MLFEIGINEFGKKYSFFHKEGTEDDWRDIISWYSHANNQTDEFNTIGLIVEPGEVPEFRVGEKAYEGFKKFAEEMTLEKLEIKISKDNLVRLCKAYPTGSVKKADFKEAAYSYFSKVGIMTESDIPRLKKTSDMGFVIDYFDVLPDENWAMKYINYWREEVK